MKYGQEEWLGRVTEILQKIIESLTGETDIKFWNCFYKWESAQGSGGPIVSGWIVNLFPYLFSTYSGLYRNEASLLPWDKPKEVADGCFPFGVCAAPFLWKYMASLFHMKFMAGFIAISQKRSYIVPSIGWAVMEKGGG